MKNAPLTMAQQLAAVLSGLQQQRTGHLPKAVSVVLSEDTLVVTMHDALTPAEKDLAKTLDGAARVQEFHRQLFANSTDEMRKEIRRITGRLVREEAAEVETATGTVVHAFTTGAMVHGVRTTIRAGSAIVVPAGANHNIVNTGNVALKLYTIYAPPNHRDAIVHHNREEAEADDEHFDGKTTE